MVSHGEEKNCVKTESETIEGDCHVEGEFARDGIVTGAATVAPGASLHLHGLCWG